MRILVVDDDLPMVQAVKRGLTAEGYAVDVALDGLEAQWLAAESPYDAIVLDIMLPRMNGDMLCGRLRAAGNWTPVLMLTAETAKNEAARALDTGADDYLSKPFSHIVLVTRLRALMRRGGAERSRVLAAGDLRLDPATRTVYRGRTRIDLSPKQHSLLEFLLRRAGEVVSKAEILTQVPDFAFDQDPEIVEVYVRQLRRHIDEPFGRRSIETVRLVGYRLDVEGG